MGQTKSSQQNGGSCQRMKEVIQGDNQVRLLLKEIKAEKNEALTSHKLGNSYCPNPLSLLVASSVSLTQKSKNNYFSHSLGLKKTKTEKLCWTLLLHKVLLVFILLCISLHGLYALLHAVSCTAQELLNEAK